MKYLLYLFVSLLFVLAHTCPLFAINAADTTIHEPLPPQYSETRLGTIKPKGWLLRQLQMMEKGTSGHLDEVYDKVKNDNGWLGGKGDGWEETPYWLDGAVPLAYLLNSAELKSKVLKYIEWTISNQRPSGYFGPVTKWERETGKKITIENCEQGEDWWPRMIMLKVLQQYYSATQDERVIGFMTKYFDYQLNTLEKCPIGKWTEWAKARGADNAMIIQWLYQKTKDKRLLQLDRMISDQSYKWSEWLGNRDWVINAAAYQDSTHWMRRHGVNVGMGLKVPVVDYSRTGNKKFLNHLKTGFTDLMTLHGLPFGMYSADEDLHGNDPTQGTELCAIVEAQFSLEKIIGVTGDVAYMDALERMTFNALPTQTTDDYNNKQYYQVANQVQVSRGVFNFSLPFNNQMNNVFGMRSGYTCCLANMHQGWTKFAAHLWYETDNNGIAALLYSPNEITTRVGKTNTPVTIREVTNYPFDDEINFEFSTTSAVEFPFQLRIPSWCTEAIITINGKTHGQYKGGQVIALKREWRNNDKVQLKLPLKVTTTMWGKNSRAVERGPLVYALKLNEKWEKEVHEKEGEYYTVQTNDDWNYGLLSSSIANPEQGFQVKEVKQAGNNFDWNLQHAPIEITTYAKKIPGWKIANDVAPQPVTDRNGRYKGEVEEEKHKITLIPYGCTTVRIVAFPVVE